MKFSYDEADKYGSSSGGNYFSLKDDGDKAEVRLLGNDMNDFPGYSVHEVKVTGNNGQESRRLVNCLREHNDPVSVCPFCEAKKKIIAKVFIPVYNIEEDEVQIWERGKGFFRTLSTYCSRNPHVVTAMTEITRQGKKGDTSTTYDLYKLDEDEEVKLEDFEDDIPEILGRYVLDKTAEDMEYFLDYGSFPEEDEDEEPVTPRRSEGTRAAARDRERSPKRSSRGSRSRRRSDEEEF